MRYKEIENTEALRVVLEAGGTLRHYAFQDIDFEPFMESALKCTFEDCLFLGGVGVEKLCDKIMKYKPGTGENELWDRIASELYGSYNFKNIIFALKVHIKSASAHLCTFGNSVHCGFKKVMRSE